MVVAKLGHRLGRRLTQFGAAVADIDAPQTGAAVDEVAPFAVLDPNPRAAGDDRRAVLQMVGDRGRRMEDALPVHLFERIVFLQIERHLSPHWCEKRVNPGVGTRAWSTVPVSLSVM